MLAGSAFVSFAFKVLRSLDRVILSLLGAERPGKYEYTLPRVANSLDMERQLIEGFFASQPNGLRLLFLRAYVFAKRFGRRAIRKLYGLAQKTLRTQKVDHG